MNHRFAKSALLGALGIPLLFSACGVAASRAPLGGSYAVADEAAAPDRTAPSARTAIVTSSAPATTMPTAKAASTAPGSAPASPPLATNGNLLRYDPLRVGDKVGVEVSVSLELGLQAGQQAAIPGDGKLSIEAKYRFDLTITQASAQTLDELEVSVTPLSVRTHYGNHASEAPLDPGRNFRVTLGRSPSVKELRGSASDDEGRAVLLLLCTTLADFHERWARAPSLELKSGWSDTLPIRVPSLLNGHAEAVRLGPALAKYSGGDASAAFVPFEIALPAAYGGSLGKLDFELKGMARLSRSQARPLSIDLRGPATGGGGPHGELNAHGFSTLNMAFSYP
jgi:hypothetical protein